MFESKGLDRQSQRMAVGRRDFLRMGAATAATLLVSPVLANPASSTERLLGFQNTHTGESVSAVYWAEGEYVMNGLEEINGVLRDHRTDEIHPMSTELLDLLFLLQSKAGSRQAYQVISGYRSPATNQALRSKSSGVARRSYHMQGKAIDIRMPGYDTKQLHRAALAMKLGGVGYYPGSDFIHVDVGPSRSW
jgi:uncharacterized protein YcbK (DUF882 family)